MAELIRVGAVIDTGDGVKQLDELLARLNQLGGTSTTKATPAFDKVSRGMAGMGTASSKTHPALRALEGSLRSLAFSAAGIPGPMGKIATTLLRVGIGSTAVVGFLAGFAAMSKTMQFFEQRAQRAREEADKTRDALQRMARTRFELVTAAVERGRARVPGLVAGQLEFEEELRANRRLRENLLVQFEREFPGVPFPTTGARAGRPLTAGELRGLVPQPLGAVAAEAVGRNALRFLELTQQLQDLDMATANTAARLRLLTNVVAEIGPRLPRSALEAATLARRGQAPTGLRLGPFVPTREPGRFGPGSAGAFAREEFERTVGAQERVFVPLKVDAQAEALREKFEDLWQGMLLGMEASFGNFLVDLKDEGLSAFVSLADNIINVWLTMIARMAASKLFLQLFGQAADIPKRVEFIQPSVVDIHEGGIVGAGGRRLHTVDPRVFLGAPQMHSGGLASDEVPAILQKGELVLPKGTRMGGEMAVHVTQNFNVAALDARGVEALLLQQRGVIAQSVLQVANESRAFRVALARG